MGGAGRRDGGDGGGAGGGGTSEAGSLGPARCWNTGPAGHGQPQSGLPAFSTIILLESEAAVKARVYLPLKGDPLLRGRSVTVMDGSR